MYVENNGHPVRNTVLGAGVGIAAGAAGGAYVANKMLSKVLTTADKLTLTTELLEKSVPNSPKVPSKEFAEILDKVTDKELIAKQYLQKLSEISKLPQCLKDKFVALIDPNTTAINGPFKKMITAETLAKSVKMAKYGLIGGAVCATLAFLLSGKGKSSSDV